MHDSTQAEAVLHVLHDWVHAKINSSSCCRSVHNDYLGRGKAFTQDSMLAESKAALAREAAARRKLHNLVQELRGNIRVFVRVKPADARARGAPVLACEDGHRIACTAAGATKACSRPDQAVNPLERPLVFKTLQQRDGLPMVVPLLSYASCPAQLWHYLPFVFVQED